jgi:DNA-binding MarR family transcriptional regulator
MLAIDIYVKCKRDKVDAKNGKAFIMLYWDDVVAAMENLTPSELKIWFYLARQINYEVWFNYKAIAEELSLSYESVKNAFRSLIKKDYIKQINENYFTFNLGTSHRDA